MTTTDIAQIHALLKKTSWLHKWEIIPGVWTPGLTLKNPKRLLDQLSLFAKNLHGKKVLDIGTFDGSIAFEASSRGACVTGFDIQNPENTGFNIAKSILGCDVQYQQGNVYNLTDFFRKQFDIIFYFGIFYHLKNPIDAFNQIRKVLKDDGILYIEGECLLNSAITLNHEQPDLDVKSIGESNIPLALSVPGIYRDSTNWFIPNKTCINSWLISTGFKQLTILEENNNKYAAPFPTQRILGSTQKTLQFAEILEHAVFPKFWRNDCSLITIEPKQGVYEEIDSGTNFFWCEQHAFLNITSEEKGVLVFCLVFPDVRFHRGILPLTVNIFKSNQFEYSVDIPEPGEYEARINIEKNVCINVNFQSNKFIIPDEHIQNNDRRKLSFLVRNFGII